MPVKGKVSNRPKKRRQEESMLGAMNAAKKGSIGAALEFAVLRASLRDRISGQVIHGTSTVHNPHLSIEQEKDIVDSRVFAVLQQDGVLGNQMSKEIESSSPGLVGCFCKCWSRGRQRKIMNSLELRTMSISTKLSSSIRRTIEVDGLPWSHKVSSDTCVVICCRKP